MQPITAKRQIIKGDMKQVNVLTIIYKNLQIDFFFVLSNEFEYILFFV